MSVRKRWCFSRTVAVAIGLCALSGVLGAQASFAAVPPAGINCVASDGKINGRGATFQTIAQNAFVAGFHDDVCGSTPSSGGDVAGNNMVIYNYPAAVSASATGSGNGEKAISCRTDPFAGSDKPYSEADLANLNGAPGAQGGCGIAFTPPFSPNASPFPNAGDVAAPMMSFPVAGSAVSVPVNLSAAACGGTAPTSINLTPDEVSRIFGGDIAKWNDPELVGTNASLTNCNIAITRVVRFDDSGTTSIFKRYLVRADGARSTSVNCAVGSAWSSFTASPNTSWPNTGTCNGLTNGGSSGNPAMIAKLQATDGGISYPDLADIQGKAGLVIASVQNATGTSFAAPNAGKGANCDFSTLALPGSNPSDSVGLNAGDNWGSDNATVNSPNPDHVNATDLGSKYPICGITFSLVYSGLSDGSAPNAVSRLSADQRRTLYSYETYILSNAAQDRLGSVSYAALPVTWLGKLRTGFQGNF